MPSTSSKREVSFPPEMVERLADLITDADDELVITTLREAIRSADLSVRAPRKPGETNAYALMPDWRVRVMAAKIMAEIKHGRPKQSVDLNVSGEINIPLSRDQAAKVLLDSWDDVKRIGDEHVKLLKQALPAGSSAIPAQEAHAVAVDVDVGDGQ